jgi:hypothetical protein
MVLITFGLWLLVIPFYPKRCSVCGCERAPAANLRQGLSQRSPWEIIGLVVVVLVILVAVFSNKSGDKPAPTISGGISDQLVAQMRADFHPSSMNWHRPLEMPEMKAIESRLFRERAAEIENYTTGEGHWLGNVAVINFCKPHDCDDHGGMLVVDTSSGQVAGSLRSPLNMDVFVGDYGSAKNIPVVLKSEIEDMNTGVLPRYQRRIRYVDGLSTVTNSGGPSEDRKVHVTPDFVGGNSLSDGRTYSVGLVVATSDIPVGTQLFAQGRVAGFGYAGIRSRPFAIIEDEQQPGKTLLCAMMPDEGTEVLSLYHQGESVQVFGEYMGALSLAGNPIMPTFSGCKVASPTDKVVRPAQVTDMPRPVPAIGIWSANSNEKGTATPATDNRSVSSTATKSDALTGTYSGRVHNTTARLSAAFGVTMQEQEGDALAGCVFVHQPLYGSGKLSGKSQTSKVTFDVPSSVGVIHFTGIVDGDDIRGTYVVQRTGVVQSGEFELHRQSELPSDFDPQNCTRDSTVQ